MPQYIAFLRAINVGGRFIKMAALAEHFRSLGHVNVSTCIHSGNVIFHSGSKSPERLAAALEAGLAPLLGFETAAFVRSAPQLGALLARAAALKAAVPAGGDLNVAFLKAPLDPAQRAALLRLHSDIDDFAHGGTELFWICHRKQSASKFSNAVLERKLRLVTTFRRVRMLETLAAELAAAEHG
jgi:uncharacterized protein (DUF1697 family)